MKRRSKERDRHLDTPAEANRDKHINFVALETGDSDPADPRPTGKLRPDHAKHSNKKTRTDNHNKKK
jgi:hypothetical protein